jgi:hypothetical protein
MRYSAITLLTFSYLTATSGLQSQVPQAKAPGVGRATTSRSSTELNVIGMETVGIAIFSAVTGAAARQPEIQGLQIELAKARDALEESKEAMVQKIEKLEDKLFEMDKAYEEQTSKFQKEYEIKKQAEIAKLSDKMKTDFKYKLGIELEREKSRLLMSSLSEVKNVDQSAKLVTMRIRQKELENTKQTLEQAVAKAEEELQELREPPKKKGFWRF